MLTVSGNLDSLENYSFSYNNCSCLSLIESLTILPALLDLFRLIKKQISWINGFGERWERFQERVKERLNFVLTDINRSWKALSSTKGYLSIFNRIICSSIVYWQEAG